ncbi:MAG: PepSY-associated TM helix domain-containing protein, partial [Vicinamibacterales bacterium]
MIRCGLVWLHRWTGLVMAVFLVIAGLTGAALAYNSELERVFAPRLFALVQPGVPALGLATLAERAEPLLAPRARVTGVVRTEMDQVQVYFAANFDPVTGALYGLDYTQFYIDPWTGAELGHRKRGDLSEGLVNVMPFLYLTHFMIVPQSQTGFFIFGLIALGWTLDCFVAFSLTLPVSLSNVWRRWWTAWKVRPGGAAYRLNVDLHRASGLWLWPLLFVFAWSSVMMNLRPVFNPVSHALFDYGQREGMAMRGAMRANDHPALDWHAALSAGERLVAEQATTQGFTVREPLGLQYNARSGSYSYEVRGSRDLFERAPKGGSTVV